MVKYTERNTRNILYDKANCVLTKKVYKAIKRKNDKLELSYDDRLYLGLVNEEYLMSENEKNMKNILVSKYQRKYIWHILVKDGYTYEKFCSDLNQEAYIEKEKEEKEKESRRKATEEYYKKKAIERKEALKGSKKVRVMGSNVGYVEGLRGDVTVILQVKLDKGNKIIKVLDVIQVLGDFYDGEAYGDALDSVKRGKDAYIGLNVDYSDILG